MISGQLRLETIHFIWGWIDDSWTIKSIRERRLFVHSSKASMMRKALLKDESFRISVKIVESALQALVSSNRAFPAWSYRARTWKRRDGFFWTSKYIKPRKTEVALLIRTSVAWQKKNETFPVLPCNCVNSSMIPHRSIVLPLPGSPLIQRRRLLWLFCHCLNSSLSKIHRYESLRSPPLVFWIRFLSSQGLVVRKSRRHAWFTDDSCWTRTSYLVATSRWNCDCSLTEVCSDRSTVLGNLDSRVYAIVGRGKRHDYG